MNDLFSLIKDSPYPLSLVIVFAFSFCKIAKYAIALSWIRRRESELALANTLDREDATEAEAKAADALRKYAALEALWKIDKKRNFLIGLLRRPTPLLWTFLSSLFVVALSISIRFTNPSDSKEMLDMFNSVALYFVLGGLVIDAVRAAVRAAVRWLPQLRQHKSTNGESKLADSDRSTSVNSSSKRKQKKPETLQETIDRLYEEILGPQPPANI